MATSINEAKKTHLRQTGNFRLYKGKVIYRNEIGAACGRNSQNLDNLVDFWRLSKDDKPGQDGSCCSQCLRKLEDYKQRIANLKQ